MARGSVSASIGDSTRPILTLEYLIRDIRGITLLAATPIQHYGLNGTEIGMGKRLPPVVWLQCLDATPQLRPLVGGGVDLTGFWDAGAKGPLAGRDLRVRSGWQLAAHPWADCWLSPISAIRVDLRRIGIAAKLRLNRTRIGKGWIIPMAAGVRQIMRC